MSENQIVSGLAPIVRRLALFFVCVLVFESLLIAVVPRLHSGSVLKITKDALLLHVGQDSWSYMAKGEQGWQEQPGALYETVFFQRDIRFIYPPSSLLFYRAWQSARHIHIAPFTALKITLLLALLGTWLAASSFFFRILPAEMILRSSSGQRWAIRILLAALIAVFLPLINAFVLGQVQTLINFFVILSALFWLRGRNTSAGILVGLTCWLKPQMALFLVWGLLRRRWNFVISLAAMLVLGLVLSCAVYGVHNTVEYLAVLQYLSHRGDALATNQSLNGMLHRVLHVGSPVTWIYGYPPYNATIYWATVVFSALLLLAALAVPMRQRISGGVVDFLLFAMATVMASPIAWEHHYGAFFIVFLLWMSTASRKWPVFLGLLGAYLLMTDNWAPLTLLMDSRWTFLISHVFFGGLILFLWTLARADRLGPQERVCRSGEFR
jgi:hypothetical protein